MEGGGRATPFAIILLIASSLLCSSASSSDSVPAFVWSNAKSVLAAQSVNYEVISGEALASRLFSGLSNQITHAEVQEPLPTPILATSGEERLDLVLAFISKELKTGHVAQYGEEEGEASPLKSLKAALSAAASSSVLPYVSARATQFRPRTVTQALIDSFRKDWPVGRIALLGDCHGAPVGSFILESVEEIKAFLEERKEGQSMDLLLVCADPASASSVHGGLIQEDATFQAAYGAVQQMGASHVALYTAEPEWATIRRSVLDGDATTIAAQNATCDATCHTKALLLEVVAVVIVLLITLLSGLCCLGAIDTPTRFELPRET